MVGHLFQNYNTIYMRFFATYTCVLSCFRRFLFPSIWPVSYKRVYICAQKSPHICVTNKHVVHGVTESGRIYKRHRIIPSAKNPFMYKIWFLFIALTVVVVVGSPTTDLLESVDCLLRDCVRYFTNADRNNDRFSQKLASDRQNTTHKLVIM